MLTKDIRKTIDNARDVLVGKIPNPQSQIEQITIAMIYKFMDDMDLEAVEFGGERQFFAGELEEFAWSKLMSTQLGAEARMNLYTLALDKLPLTNSIPKLFRDIFKGAYLPFRDAQTLSLFLKEINDISYDNSENLGNAFEYLLSIMGSQGDAGQFRTPRHIIDFIVKVVNPTKNDTILDPACGTSGFLISAYKHIVDTAKNTNQLLSPDELNALTENIQGYDISPDMVKLALVNMYLHKFKEPKIFEYDTLTNLDRWDNYFDCILANPPFMTPKGGIQPHNRFGVKANRSEVLFVDYIMEHLNSTGRAGIIVPEGIVFQSANAYKELRKKLVEENYLYAVISLPSGVFQPYSGVKTSILLMDKQLAKKTNKIFFVEIQNDGFDLGAQRREIDKNDLPEVIEIINQWQNIINNHSELNLESLTKSKLVTIVEKSKLAENGEYNLTASRYKVVQDFSNCKWNMVQLSTVAEFIGGYAFKSENLLKAPLNDKFLPVIKIGNILKDGSLDVTNVQYYDKTNLEKYNIRKKDILVAMTGATVGKVACSEYDNLLLNQRTGIVRANCNINPDYLKHLLFSNNYYAYCQRMAGGGAQGNISPTQIVNYEIPLPPLEIQEEIVKELDGYQAVIDGAQKVIDNWKPTLPINPNWKKVKLGDIFKFTQGINTAVDKLNYVEFGIKVLQANNIYKGKINFDNLKFITEEEYNSINAKYKPANGDILYSNIGARFGYASLVDINEAFTFSWNVLRLEALTSNLNSFIAYLLNTDFIRQEVLKRASTSTMPFISGKEMKLLDIPLPNINEQQEFVLKIQEEEKAIAECKKLIKIHKQKINDKIQSIWGNE